MEEEKLETLADISLFLQSKDSLSMRLKGSKAEVYKWIEATLVRFHYMRLKKRADKGLVLQYIRHSAPLISVSGIKSEISFSH